MTWPDNQIRWLDELILELQKVQFEHGNLPVASIDDWTDTLECPVTVRLVPVNECSEPRDGFDVKGHKTAVQIV